MKTIVAILVLIHSTFSFSAIAQDPTSVRGCVVFKLASQTTASMKEYRKFENFGTSVAVIDLAGNLLRIVPNENPIFIPYPTDSSATLERVTAQIANARKTYPELSRQLTVIEKAWAAVPQAKVATMTSTPLPSPGETPKELEIVTKSGAKYENVTVTLVEPDGLSISHNTGLIKLPFTDLPAELQTKYGYDTQKAEEFAAATQESLRQKALMQQKAAEAQQVQEEQLKRTKCFDVVVDDVVEGRGAVVSPLSSTDELPSYLFVEGLKGVAEGERYEIHAFLDGKYTHYTDEGRTTRAMQRWTCKSFGKELHKINPPRVQPSRRPPSTSLEHIGF